MVTRLSHLQTLHSVLCRQEGLQCRPAKAKADPAKSTAAHSTLNALSPCENKDLSNLLLSPISNMAVEKKDTVEKINIFSFSLFPAFSANIPDLPQASGSTSGHCSDCCCLCCRLARSCNRPQSNQGGVVSQASQSHLQS